jgi:protein TonB
MAFSFGPPHAPAHAPPHPATPSRARPGRPNRGIDLSFAPNGAGADRLSIAGLLDHDGVGTDWTNAFSAWLARHTYYPSEAGMLGEHGDVVVEFVVEADGAVRSLHLVTSSGHPLLDTATLAMFRDARLPPLNPADGARLPIHFTMHYIIRR